jgi:uncharacterized membrane protein YfcA
MQTDILLFLAGLFVGTMNAVAGGGMLLGFPVLLLSGLTALAANATGNIVVLPGQLASAYGYRKYLRTVPKQYLILLVPCVIGAVLGALLLRRTPGSNFEMYVPWLLLVAVGLFAFQPFLHNHLHHHLKSKYKPIKPLLLIALALFPLPIYGGYFGAGFGFVVLAFLGFTSLTDIHQMNAMKNIAAASISLMSIIVLANGSFINWHAGLVMAAGSTIGGYSGSRLAQRIPNHAIRVIVIVIGLITAVYIGLHH